MRRDVLAEVRGIVNMGYIEGHRRNQGTLFPAVLDDRCLCRWAQDESIGPRASGSSGNRPAWDDPRELLKLYLYGYLNQIRSSLAG
jgi:hypothetical protein